MSKKNTDENNTFKLLHELDKKLQKRKSERENSQNKYKESRPFREAPRRRSPSPFDRGHRESYKRRSPSPFDRGNRDSKRAKNKESESISPVIEIDDDVDYDIPDRSLGDFLCKLCDAHMNSECAWETHIQGKRHLKNLKKGDLDLKYDTLNEDPQILSELKAVDEPIVGLNHCCEFQRLEGRPTYQCFLCSAHLSNGKLLIEHLIGTKHMMAYLKQHDPTSHNYIINSDINKGMLEPVIQECALNHKRKHGSGQMQVKKELSKPLAPSYYKAETADNRKKEYSERNSNWRKISEPENDYRKRRHSITPPRKFRNEYCNSPPRKFRDEYCNSPPRDANRSLTPPRNIDWSHNHDSYVHREVSKKNSRRFSSYEENASSYAEPVPSYERNNFNSFVREGAPIQTLTPVLSSQPQCSEIKTDDLRLVLEQKKEDNTKMEKSYMKKVLDIISNLPTVIFLELVRIRVEQIEKTNPSDAELSLLKSVGNLMLSIVMGKKINDLSPEMFSKFIEAVKPKTSDIEASSSFEMSNKSSNLSDLMRLISQLKGTPTSTSLSEQRPQHEPVFSTSSSTSQNTWSHQPILNYTQEQRGIPGLTLAEPVYSQFGPVESKPNNNSSWPSSSTDQFKDFYQQY